jgi:hypothetical protein
LTSTIGCGAVFSSDCFIDLFSMNDYILWSLDTDPNFVTADFIDRDRDIVSDTN